MKSSHPLLPPKRNGAVVKVAVATVVKTHGVKGELNVALTDMAEPELDFAPGACLIAEIEGLDVPFFIKGSRARGADSLLLQFDEVQTDAEAAALQGLTLYALTAPAELEVDPDDLTAGALVGYDVVADGQNLGTIADLQELTPGQWFFIVDERMIPAVDEFILEIDPEQRVVTMELPEGLTEL